MTENVAEQVIRAFGGLTAMSKATGWPVPTIQGWKTSGCIPEWRRDRIVSVAAEKQISLPPDYMDIDESVSPNT